MLDFPTLEDFTAEITENRYDIIGIGAIMPEHRQGQEDVRADPARISPAQRSSIGGHISNKEGLDGTDRCGPYRAGRRDPLVPAISSGQDDRGAHPAPHGRSRGSAGGSMGIDLRQPPGGTAAILIPSVGCPVGCNFCSTSALFGGKGKFVNFYETGDELFAVMCEMEKKLEGAILLRPGREFPPPQEAGAAAPRADGGKRKELGPLCLQLRPGSAVLYDRSTGEAGDRLGLDGAGGRGERLRQAQGRGHPRARRTCCRTHGIRVLGSSIIGLEDHTPENMDAIIDYAVSHDTGLPPVHALHARFRARRSTKSTGRTGRSLPETEFPAADAHGQYRFNYRHPHIQDGREEEYLLDAFRRDFAVNGPSLLRLIRVDAERLADAHGTIPDAARPQSRRLGRGAPSLDLRRGRVGHEEMVQGK
ncbi:MAG: hypothetical protein MZV70_75645 [Desulfobacterales bacterium]|nr:hypothetical protein [Desulfobacterales bacterium]